MMFGKINKSKLTFFLFGAAAIALLIIGAWLRWDNLGKNNFANDEYYHLNTAYGYLQTGQFVKWNFLADEPYGEYLRAWPYTWLVAQSFKLFGVSEWAARLPSLFFGLLTLPLIAFLAYRFSRDKWLALLVLFLATFDNSLIWSSRLSRMYSLFIFLSLICIYLFYLALEGKFKNKYEHYFILFAAGLFFVLAYIVHEAAILLLLGLLVYFLIQSCRELKNRNFTFKNKYYLLTLLFILGLGGGLFITILSVR